MRQRLQQMLCCPTCAGDLVLRSFDGESTDSDLLEPNATRNGALCCGACSVWYPVMEYIPVMLTFTTPVHTRFAARHAASMGALQAFSTPKGQPMPGERSVQQTFSEEWDLIHDNDLSFSFTADELVELNRQVWLRPLQKTRDEFKSVLNIGVGIAQETIALQKAIGNAEIVGVDLNFALLQRGKITQETPNLHLVIASLFRLPFRRESFDVVYSQGVIHHTYSTKAAFENISKFVRPGGHLFIWVYSLDSHLIAKGMKGFVLRRKLGFEKVFRPLVSRSPSAVREVVFWSMTAILHPIVLTFTRNRDKWRWENTDHGLRDWLSPRFAHRHAYNEVLEWYEVEAFDVVGVNAPGTYRRLFNKQQYGVGVLGQRTASQQAPSIDFHNVHHQQEIKTERESVGMR